MYKRFKKYKIQPSRYLKGRSMEIELLMIGNEILIGKTQDTNSNWMTKRITKFGHKVKRITTIGDELETISDTLRDILKRNPDIIVVSGGLIIG